MMELPILGNKVVDMMGVIHDECPDASDAKALFIHAFTAYVAADRYFHTILDVAAAEDPEIAGAVATLRAMVAPAFRPKESAEIVAFPSPTPA